MLLVIEGIDGAGKGTQTNLLKKQAMAMGLKVGCISFPRYGETLFSATIADYLNGKFGSIDEVPAEFSSLLFAGDRFESRGPLSDAIEKNDIVLLDRYVSSNIAYHAARIPIKERDNFINWLSSIEYELYSLPKPDLTIFYDVPAKLAVKMVLKKGSRSYTKSKADIHESREDYMKICRQIFLELQAQNFGGKWIRIDCVDENNNLFSPEHLASIAWAEAIKILNNIN